MKHVCLLLHIPCGIHIFLHLELTVAFMLIYFPSGFYGQFKISRWERIWCISEEAWGQWQCLNRLWADSLPVWCTEEIFQGSPWQVAWACDVISRFYCGDNVCLSLLLPHPTLQMGSGQLTTHNKTMELKTQKSQVKTLRSVVMWQFNPQQWALNSWDSMISINGTAVSAVF